MPADAARAHRNLVEYQQRAARWMPDGTVIRTGGVILTECALPFPAFRTLTVDGVGAVADPAATYATARERWHTAGDGFILYARPGLDDDLAAAATAAGAFDFGAGAPEMVCAARLDDRPDPDGIDVRRVDDAAGVAAYAAVAGQSFADLGWPGDQISASFAVATELVADDVFMFVAWDGPDAVAAAMSVVLPGSGGYISWVAALDRVRRRGLGEAVTRAATNAAFDAGATFTSLEASHMGEPVYARMGYETRYRYRFVVTLAS